MFLLFRISQEASEDFDLAYFERILKFNNIFQKVYKCAGLKNFKNEKYFEKVLKFSSGELKIKKQLFLFR